MKTNATVIAAGLLALMAIPAMAGDRGDRANQRLDARGEHINERLDVVANVSISTSTPGASASTSAWTVRAATAPNSDSIIKGNRIENRLDLVAIMPRTGSTFAATASTAGSTAVAVERSTEVSGAPA